MNAIPTSLAIADLRTPLAAAGRLGPDLWFKLESCQPTGSYKDRFIAAELQRVLAEGRKLCVATSSGNTGSSLAAHCARHGIACVILVNADAPSGKLLQMQAHGAKVLRIPEFVTSPEVTQQVFAQLTAFTENGPAALVVSAFRYCPVGMDGVRAIAREIVEQLPATRHVFVPVGSGGLFAAVSMEMHRIQPATRVHAVQPEGCPTIWNAFRMGASAITPVTSTTRISGLSVPFDIDGGLALRCLREHGGEAFGVSDAAVYQAQRDMLRTAGIYSEPAGATALAGYHQAREQGVLADGEAAVCLVTGHGFKDPASMEAAAQEVPGITVSPSEVRAVLEEVAR
jgi:threonine synthase